MTDLQVRATALRMADGHFPGWIEVVVEDAEGRSHHIVEKVPALTDGALPTDLVFPLELWLSAQMEETDGQKVTVALDWGVATVDGLGRLTVRTQDVCWP